MDLLPAADQLVKLNPFTQVCFLAAYLYVLFRAAECIGEGSDKLLTLYGPGIVGGFIIPILGAIPEGAITLFSGLGQCPQQTLGVGIGTLSGSTVMLLTLPYALSMFVGYRDLDEDTGKAASYMGSDEPKVENGFTLTKSVITVVEENTSNAKWMMLASLGYWAVAIPAVIFQRHKTPSTVHKEHFAALIGMVVSFLIFVGYSIWSIKGGLQSNDEEKIDSLFEGRLPVVDEGDESEEFLAQQDQVDYGGDYSGISDYGSISDYSVSDRSVRNDTKSPIFSEKEFEDEEETPSSLFFWGTMYILWGAAVTVFFSGPMVESISALSQTINIRPFFIAFFLTPAVGNITEIYAAILFASKKTTDGISTSLATLYGAAIMNSTFVLGVFCLMMFVRHLVWTFIAETIIILVTMFIVGIIGLRTTIKMWQGFLLILLFPLCIVFVGVFGRDVNGPLPVSPPGCKVVS